MASEPEDLVDHPNSAQTPSGTFAKLDQLDVSSLLLGKLN